MNFRLNKTAAAVTQALACLALAGCGGAGGDGTDSQGSTAGTSGGSTGQNVAGAVAAASETRTASAAAVTGTAASLRLDVMSAAGGSMLPFTAGQALQQGQVPSGSSVVADIPNFQFVVKNRWPDGSAKFAVMSGRTDLTASTWKTIGLSVSSTPAGGTAVSTADLAATGVTASIQFGSFGTAAWNAGDWGTPAQTVVSGPEMSAFTYRKPIGSDAHLVAWLEVRAYKGGRVEVMPWIENGYLLVPNPTSKSGTATFTLDGTQRFSQSLNLLNHQRAVLASGTTLTHWHGGDPQVTPRHNTA